jgi:hypothetical protein
MSLFAATALYKYQPIVTSAAFVYYGATGTGSINLGFQKWFKGVQSTSYTTDPIPSASYNITVRSIENGTSSSAYSVPSGQLFNITGSISGAAALNMFTTANFSGDERNGKAVGFGMLVEGPSDLRSYPLNSMPRPIAKKIKIRPSLANLPFNYISAGGLVTGSVLASTGTDYFFDVQGISTYNLNQNDITTIGYFSASTASFSGYVEGTRQYTFAKARGTSSTISWLKQFATASMDMQNALVNAASYTLTSALPPEQSNAIYTFSGSAII